MVDEQIIGRGINDPQVLGAMYRIERHRFLPDEYREEAYADSPVSIPHGQTISQPYIVALMTQELRLTEAEKVLEIGTGSGYQTALLSEMANEVYTVERFSDLSDKASALLRELGYKNIRFAVGDGTLGWKDAAPFDRMILTAACPRIPFPLEEQLAEGGQIILPLGDQHRQILIRAAKKNGRIVTERICDCVFVPLVGEFGMIKS